MIKLALTAAILAATPAVAAQTDYRPTARDFREGICTRHQARIPAGKIVHAPPSVRCDQAALIARATLERSPASASVTADANLPLSLR